MFWICCLKSIVIWEAVLELVGNRTRLSLLLWCGESKKTKKRERTQMNLHHKKLVPWEKVLASQTNLPEFCSWDPFLRKGEQVVHWILHRSRSMHNTSLSLHMHVHAHVNNISNTNKYYKHFKTKIQFSAVSLE